MGLNTSSTCTFHANEHIKCEVWWNRKYSNSVCDRWHFYLSNDVTIWNLTCMRWGHRFQWLAQQEDLHPLQTKHQIMWCYMYFLVRTAMEKCLVWLCATHILGGLAGKKYFKTCREYNDWRTCRLFARYIHAAIEILIGMTAKIDTNIRDAIQFY